MTDLLTDLPPSFDLGQLAKNLDESTKNQFDLLYGDSKVGKTTVAAQFPAPLFLSCGGRFNSLTKTQEIRDLYQDVKIIPNVDSASKLALVVNRLALGDMPDRLTIILDNISEFEDQVTDKWMDYADRNGLLSKDAKRHNPQWPEYKQVTAVLKEQLWKLRDLDKHLILLAHSRDDADKARGGRNVIRPDLMQKFSQMLEQAVDTIGFMYVENDIHRTRLKADVNIVAGSRIWIGDPVVDNLSGNMLLNNTNKVEGIAA